MLQHCENERDAAEIEHWDVLEKKGEGERERESEAIYVVDIQKSRMALIMTNILCRWSGVYISWYKPAVNLNE